MVTFRFSTFHTRLPQPLHIPHRYTRRVLFSFLRELGSGGSATYCHEMLHTEPDKFYRFLTRSFFEQLAVFRSDGFSLFHFTFFVDQLFPVDISDIVRFRRVFVNYYWFSYNRTCLSSRRVV